MKTGLDYFPLDVDWLADDKLTLLLADYGNRGLGVLVRLLGEIYRSGYALPWGEREQKRFAMRCLEPIPDVLAIVDLLLKEGFFDERLSRGPEPVLTSVGIQKRWAFAASRRQNKTIEARYNLLDDAEKAGAMTTSAATERGEMQAKHISETNPLHTKGGKVSTKASAHVGWMSTNGTAQAQAMLTFTQQSRVKDSKGSKINPPNSPFGEVTFPPQLDTPEHRAAWDRFIAHRKAIRRPYRSIESQNAQLQRWADRPEAFISAVENAIANSYQGLFSPRGEVKNKTGGLIGRTERALDVVSFYEEQEAGEL